MDPDENTKTWIRQLERETKPEAEGFVEDTRIHRNPDEMASCVCVCVCRAEGPGVSEADESLASAGSKTDRHNVVRGWYRTLAIRDPNTHLLPKTAAYSLMCKLTGCRWLRRLQSVELRLAVVRVVDDEEHASSLQRLLLWQQNAHRACFQNNFAKAQSSLLPKQNSAKRSGWSSSHSLFLSCAAFSSASFFSSTSFAERGASAGNGEDCRRPGTSKQSSTSSLFAAESASLPVFRCQSNFIKAQSSLPPMENSAERCGSLLSLLPHSSLSRDERRRKERAEASRVAGPQGPPVSAGTPHAPTPAAARDPARLPGGVLLESVALCLCGASYVTSGSPSRL